MILIVKYNISFQSFLLIKIGVQFWQYRFNEKLKRTKSKKLSKKLDTYIKILRN